MKKYSALEMVDAIKIRLDQIKNEVQYEMLTSDGVIHVLHDLDVLGTAIDSIEIYIRDDVPSDNNVTIEGGLIVTKDKAISIYKNRIKELKDKLDTAEKLVGRMAILEWMTEKKD